MLDTMKKLLCAILLFLPVALLTSCGGFSAEKSAELIEKINSGAELTQDDYSQMMIQASKAIPVIEQTNEKMKAAAKSGQVLDLNKYADYADASRAYETFTFILATDQERFDETNARAYEDLLEEIKAFNEAMLR